MATFPLSDETHGGEDVSVYAIGPQVSCAHGKSNKNKNKTFDIGKRCKKVHEVPNFCIKH